MRRRLPSPLEEFNRITRGRGLLLAAAAFSLLCLPPALSLLNLLWEVFSPMALDVIFPTASRELSRVPPDPDAVRRRFRAAGAYGISKGVNPRSDLVEVRPYMSAKLGSRRLPR